MKEAMRAKEAERLSVLRMAKSALMNAAIEKYGSGSKLQDPDSIVVLRKQLKQRQDSIEGFLKGDRKDLDDKERREMEVLGAYLPQQLSEVQIDQIVSEATAETGATSKSQMGSVMKVVTSKAAGRADGKTLSQAVQKALA